MTIEEAIQHCDEVASKCEFDTDWGMGNHFIDRSGVADVIECAKEHRQLAEWLKELKQLREQTRWIPVSERLPEKEGRYLTTILNNYDNLLRYIMTCDYFSNGCWCPDNECASNNVIAWMPLPEPYKAESEVKDADSD